MNEITEDELYDIIIGELDIFYRGHDEPLELHMVASIIAEKLADELDL